MSNEHASRRWMISHKTHFSILITWFSFFFLSWNMTYICKFFDGKLAKNFWVKLCMPKSKLLACTYLFVPMFPAHCKIRTYSIYILYVQMKNPLFFNFSSLFSRLSPNDERTEKWNFRATFSIKTSTLCNGFCC